MLYFIYNATTIFVGQPRSNMCAEKRREL